MKSFRIVLWNRVKNLKFQMITRQTYDTGMLSPSCLKNRVIVLLNLSFPGIDGVITRKACSAAGCLQWKSVNGRVRSLIQTTVVSTPKLTDIADTEFAN